MPDAGELREPKWNPSHEQKQLLSQGFISQFC